MILKVLTFSLLSSENKKVVKALYAPKTYVCKFRFLSLYFCANAIEMWDYRGFITLSMLTMLLFGKICKCVLSIMYVNAS